VLRAVRQLTKIRNEFAHNLSRERLTVDDDAALAQSVKGTELGKALQKTLNDDSADAKRPGYLSRLVLIALVVHVQSMEQSVRVQPRSLESSLSWYGITEDELLKLLDLDGD